MSEEKRIFKIPIGNMSREEAEKMLSVLLKEYRTPDNNYSWLREYEKTQLLKNRKQKLNKLWTKNSQ